MSNRIDPVASSDGSTLSSLPKYQFATATKSPDNNVPVAKSPKRGAAYKRKASAASRASQIETKNGFAGLMIGRKASFQAHSSDNSKSDGRESEVSDKDHEGGTHASKLITNVESISGASLSQAAVSMTTRAEQSPKRDAIEVGRGTMKKGTPDRIRNDAYTTARSRVRDSSSDADKDVHLFSQALGQKPASLIASKRDRASFQADSSGSDEMVASATAFVKHGSKPKSKVRVKKKLSLQCDSRMTNANVCDSGSAAEADADSEAESDENCTVKPKSATVWARRRLSRLVPVTAGEVDSEKLKQFVEEQLALGRSDRSASSMHSLTEAVASRFEQPVNDSLRRLIGQLATKWFDDREDEHDKI